jgi:hypothetical protein
VISQSTQWMAVWPKACVDFREKKFCLFQELNLNSSATITSPQFWLSALKEDIKIRVVAGVGQRPQLLLQEPDARK